MLEKMKQLKVLNSLLISVLNEQERCLVIKTFRQIFKFVIVGLINTSITFLAIFIIINFCGGGPLIANLIGYVFGIIVGFILNKLWTFNSKKSISKVLLRYILAVSISYFLNLVVILFGLQVFNIDVYLVQLFGCCTYTITMFIICKYFVFVSHICPINNEFK